MSRLFGILLILLAFLFATGAGAQTGSVKTQMQLNNEVNSLWPDNNTGQITPFNSRQTLLDMIATQFAASGITTGTSACTICTVGGILYSNGSVVLSSSVLGVAASGLTINSANGISYPSSDTTANGSLAIGPFALTGQTASASYENVAVGYQAIGAALTTAATQNTAVGFQAMALNTAGNANAAVGTQSLLHNTTGAFNSALGSGALGANTTGSENVALGAAALSGNTTGGFNIGIGFLCCGGTQTGTFNIWMGEAAAPANTSGSSNIGIGQGVMAANTTGTGNLAVGNAALAGNTTNGSQFAMGSQAMQKFTGTSGVNDIRNTAVGHFTLQTMTVGGYNTALGFEAGLFLGGNAGGDCTGSCTGNTALGALANTYTTAGNFNTGVGYFALFGNNRADSPTFTANYAFNNTAVGANAGLAIENGGQNTLIGMNAGKAITGTTGPPATDGDDNTALGYNAGSAITTGIRNIAIGSGANTNGTTGAGNIVIGYGLNVSAPTVSNELHIGYNGVDTITGNTSAKWVKFPGQIISTTGAPTIASGACGAGSNGAVVAGSTNQSGNITIGAAATTTCTIAWSATLAVAPNACVFFPANATAAATGTTIAYTGAPSTTQVVLTGTVLANANYSYVCL